MSSSYIPTNLRNQVIERANELCEYCLIPLALQVSGNIHPLTPKGRATARLLQFNQSFRIAERRLLILSRV